MPTIERLSAAAVDYLISFNAHAVAISPKGKVYTSANPTGAALAWWCRRHDAVRLAKAAQATGNVEGMARMLRITLTPHAVVLERVAERNARLDEALQRAQESGLLKDFNNAYRWRRLSAQKTGTRFMSFPAAQRRLRQVLTQAVANGGKIDQSIIGRALAYRNFL
jgi:hypothetical protein